MASGITRLNWAVETDEDRGFAVCDHGTPNGLVHLKVASAIATEQEAALMASAPILLRLLFQTVGLLDGTYSDEMRDDVLPEATHVLTTLIDFWDQTDTHASDSDQP